MKTTNLEISKKLKEIGFEAKTDKCWAKIRNSKLDKFSIRTLDFSIPANCDEWYPAYDLETLINALPKQYKDKFGDTYYLTFTAYSIYYEPEFWTLSNQHQTVRKEKESLADTAGRLIIRLWEFQTFGEGLSMKKKIIKFKK